MPVFKVSCDWIVYGTAYIEADNLEQAITKAEEDDFPLPTDTNYIDGSFNVDRQSTIELNRETSSFPNTKAALNQFINKRKEN